MRSELGLRRAKSTTDATVPARREAVCVIPFSETARALPLPLGQRAYHIRCARKYLYKVKDHERNTQGAVYATSSLAYYRRKLEQAGNKCF